MNTSSYNGAEFIKNIRIDPTNATFISIDGITNNSGGHKCKTIGKSKYIYFNYDSPAFHPTNPANPLKVYRDVFDLFKDMRAIRTDSVDPNNYARMERLLKLKYVIKCELKKTVQSGDLPLINPPQNVVLVATSHGAIIMHAAVLLLKMDIDITAEHLARLRFFTIGCPQHPQPLLLSPYEQGGKMHLVNFYHSKDGMLTSRVINGVIRFFGARHPLLPGSIWNKSISPYNFDIVKREGKDFMRIDQNMRVVVHDTDYIKDLSFELIHGSAVYHISYSMIYPTYILSVPYQPTKHSDYMSNPLLLTESSNSDKLLPTFEVNWMLWNSMHDLDPIPESVKVCGPGQFFSGGGATFNNYNNTKKRVYIPKRNRAYVVHKDKDSRRQYVIIKRQRVYLSTIRGQYKSIPMQSL
jgi:hypothetical protein